jgi:hypothetical protein
LRRYPLRERRITPAVLVHHVQHHEGDINRFWLGETESACFRCHEEMHGRGRGKRNRLTFGVDGWPIEAAETM